MNRNKLTQLAHGLHNRQYYKEALHYFNKAIVSTDTAFVTGFDFHIGIDNSGKFVLHAQYYSGQIVSFQNDKTNDPTLFTERADCYEKIGKIESAISDYRNASLLTNHRRDNQILLCTKLIDFARLDEVKNGEKIYYCILFTLEPPIILHGLNHDLSLIHI